MTRRTPSRTNKPSRRMKPAKPQSSSAPQKPAAASTLRVIGGDWRSRKLAFYPAEGLRPTLDRVRETAFNWLAPYMTGAECLDLFAGSGALTFEALSRGAGFVHTNELNPQVANTIKAQLDLLKCEQGKFLLSSFNGESPSATQINGKFDVIFLDPPFRKDLLERCCQNLEALNIFKPNCHIYIESETALEQLELPNNWELIKQKKAGQTHYGLAVRTD